MEHYDWNDGWTFTPVFDPAIVRPECPDLPLTPVRIPAYRMKFVMGRRGFSGCRRPAALPASMHWSSQAMFRPSSRITAQPSSSCRTWAGLEPWTMAQ